MNSSAPPSGEQSPKLAGDVRVKRLGQSRQHLHKPLLRLTLAATSLAAAGVLAAALFIWLVFLPSYETRTLNALSKTVAAQQAQRLGQYLDGLEARLAGLASSGVALALYQHHSPEAVEQLLLDAQPDLDALRVIAVDDRGTAVMSANSLRLRNQIELDLVRRAANNGRAQVEYYVADGQSWVSWAARDSDLEQPGLVLLASASADTLAAVLRQSDPEQGLLILQQSLPQQTRTVLSEVVRHGLSENPGYAQAAALPGRAWTVSFSPSNAWLDQVSPSYLPLAIASFIGLLLAVLACASLSLQLRKLLLLNARRLLDGEFQKLSTREQLAELAPLAKRLRGATLRANRPSAFQEAANKPARAATIEFPELRNPIFLRTEAEQAKPDSPEAELERFPRHIFRAYDIRGVAGKELSAKLADQIARAIGTLAGREGSQTLLVGCDARLSSPELKNAVILALLQTGRDVIDIGTVPTPLLYFGIATAEADSGIMITGSHNPKQHNGMKIVIGGKRLHGEAIQRLLERTQSRDFSKGEGHRIRKDLVSKYIERLLEDIAIGSPLRLVIDAGNGVSGVIAPHFFEELGCDVQTLYCDLDGNFPNRSPDTSDEANLKDLCTAVVGSQADLGIAFDGDGDRVAVVSASGKIVRTDQLLMLLARDVLPANPGADVVFDVKCSQHLADYISELGGRPVVWKTGHAPIKSKLDETRAPLAGEFSGHIFFADRWYGFDDGLYAAARLVEILSSSGQTLDELLAGLPGGISTPELLIPVPEEQKFAVVEAVNAHFDTKGASVNRIDGLRIDYPDGWGLVRASNTSAALTLRFEGDNQQALQRIQQQFRAALQAVDETLELPF